jgi:hypothetical protein
MRSAIVIWIRGVVDAWHPDRWTIEVGARLSAGRGETKRPTAAWHDLRLGDVCLLNGVGSIVFSVGSAVCCTLLGRRIDLLELS